MKRHEKVYRHSPQQDRSHPFYEDVSLSSTQILPKVVLTDASIAQLVEHPLRKRQVVCSNPTWGFLFPSYSFHILLCDVSAVSLFLHYVRYLVPVMLSTQDDDGDTMDFRSEDLKNQRALSLNRDLGMDDEIARFKEDETNVDIGDLLI